MYEKDTRKVKKRKMTKQYKSDKECLQNESKYKVDGGTTIVAYLLIAVIMIVMGLGLWFYPY